MKIFIFEYLDQVSDNWHGGGGLTVIAKDKAQVTEMVNADKDIVIGEEEWEDVKVYDLADEHAEPKIFVFPDAGCC